MKIREFSHEQLAGQRLMIGFDGTRFNENLKYCIETLKVGGVILFARNIEGPVQLQNLCRDIQACAADCGQPPLIIAVDQEGGVVARLKAPFTEFPGNPAMTGADDAREFARITASELNSVGINMNMAPVMDIAFEGIESIMASRAFGSDPDRVSRLGTVVISELQKGRIMAVAKHFPGIGRTVLDSHLDLPVLPAAPKLLETFDLIPFQAAIDCPVSGIMLSHILYPKIDPTWPASLSPRIARDMLRVKMGYDGVVLTDDMDMGAIKGRFEIPTIVRQVVAADIDLMLICHPGPDIRFAHEEFVRALRGLEDDFARGVESVRRLMGLRQRFIG